jgi:predicted ester cyclase
MSRSALPDFHSTLEDMIAEGDKVAERFTGRGTHKGEWMGIAPTGKQVTIQGMAIHRITDGKIVENWTNMDMLGVMVQLGVVPPPGQAGG